jgi:pimeloyl-[acyl-carrier protein] methyl ester esterase
MTRVLWIHGWGMSPSVWGDLDHLLPGYRHERFSYADCHTVGDVRDKLDAVLAHSGEPWILIGWSLGGMLVLEACAKYVGAERNSSSDCKSLPSIEAVVIVASTLQFVHKDRTKGWPAKIVERMRNQVITEPELTLRRFAISMFSEKERAALNKSDLIQSDGQARNKWPAELNGPTDFTSDWLEGALKYFIEANLNPLWQEHIAPRLQTGRLKLIWLHGTDDPICPPGCIPAELAHLKRTVLMEGAGHVPFLTQRDLFYDHLRSFLYGAG